MDLLDKIITGFLAVWGLLLLAVLARAVHNRKAIPMSVVLPWLNLLFMSLFYLAIHHPGFRRAYPTVAWSLFLGWGACAFSVYGLSRRRQRKGS